MLSDDEFEAWAEQWETITAEDRLTHMQKLFRMLLSDDLDDSSQFYYSFCQDDVVETDMALC